MQLKIIFIFIAFTFWRGAYAQDTTYKVVDSLPKIKIEIPVIPVIEDSINDENIQTVLIHKTGWEMAIPIISLNTDETISLSFDEFGEDVRRYKYTLLQCDADWKPSELPQNQYLDGFYEDNITDFKLSVNTIQTYIHYNLIFPKETMKITKSGNYIIRIYNENNPDNTLIIKRFFVMEQKVNINGKIKDATLLNDKKYKQEVDFNIVCNNFNINNPSQNLKVKIFQNMRPDNAICNLKPHLVKGNELDYDYEEGNTFNGCNEYRNFDIKSLKYNSMRINHIAYEDRANQVYLHNDIARRFKVYKTEDDINGKRVIKVDNTKDSEVEADYTYVHFSLPYDIPTVEGYIFIYGALTNWKLDDDSKMTYNYKNRAYEGSVYVKQGYYNYMYILQHPDKKLDDTFVEGNHAETENDYFIFVYYRQNGEQYDKLIGFRQLNSINDRN
ncbi:MAG: DUF5103 domain-containing protein [Bacteroidetes bacterium]|nr:DUF5103 domain-containing protein [Bacteroidota bacterium]